MIKIYQILNVSSVKDALDFAKAAKKEWAKEKQPKFNDGTLLVEEKSNFESITATWRPFIRSSFICFLLENTKVKSLNLWMFILH
nr:hypothetical protein [Mycoplasmopsis bovis]